MLDPIREASGNVSRAWLRAFLATYESPQHEALGLAVEVNAPDETLQEESSIRKLLDDALRKLHARAPRKHAGVDTVASTLFPRSLWNPARPRDQLFSRYQRVLPHLKRDPRNAHGMYFERFLKHNQLDQVIRTRVDAGNMRRSAYQVIVFDPTLDHGDWRQRGFPCLHQVSFVPDKEKGMHVVAYYATQTIFEKAYGNYMGLWALGKFVAHEWGLRMTGLTCIAAVAKASNKNGPLVRQLKQALERFT